MKIAFICPNENKTAYSEFIPLTLFLKENGMDCVFITAGPIETIIKQRLSQAGLCFYEGINFHKNGEITSSIHKRPNKNIKLLRKIKAMMGFAGVLVGPFLSLHLNIKLARKILKQAMPDAIVLFGDRTLELTPGSILWARKHQKPIFEIIMAANTRDFVVFSRGEKGKKLLTTRPLNKLIALIFPQQVHKAYGQEYLFYSWQQTLALTFYRMLPQSPWWPGASFADHILTISDQAKQEYPNNLHPKISVVGQYSLDALFLAHQKRHATRKKIINTYFPASAHIEQDIIAVALPQFYEHNIFSKEKSIAIIETLVCFLAQVPGKKFLLSLHPKMNPEDYRFLNDKTDNIALAESERLYEFLPCCDFLISYFKSVINWAILCDVVPIYLNFHNQGFKFDSHSSVITFQDENTFALELRDLLENKQLLQQNIANDKQHAPPFDGSAGKRILNALRTICNDKS